MGSFFTSDQHFNHKNILKYEVSRNGIFKSIDHMNESLIQSWNRVVTNQDVVHHLGDFAFGNIEDWRNILDQLKGKIILYKGNHDDWRIVKKLYEEGYFEDIYYVGNHMRTHKMNLFLTHYPLDVPRFSNEFSISGHIHSQVESKTSQVNVGIDGFLARFILIKDGRNYGEPIHEDDLVPYLKDKLNNSRKRGDM